LFEGLESNVQLSGFALRLLPSEATAGVDIESTKPLLLDDSSFELLPTLVDSDMPRASRVLQNYRSCYLRLIYQHIQSDELDEANAALAAMNRNVPEDILPMPDQYRNNVEALEGILTDREGSTE